MLAMPGTQAKGKPGGTKSKYWDVNPKQLEFLKTSWRSLDLTLGLFATQLDP